MSLRSNLVAFMASRGGDPLVNSYLMLIGFELALKNAGYIAARGHDVPEMLVVASRKGGLSPAIAGQLKSQSSKLKAKLSILFCQGRAGNSQKVPAHSYPYIRYCRYVGDWNGVQENSRQDFYELELFCRQLVSFLKAQRNSLGLII